MVKRSPGVPDRGDAIWLDFTPQSGREQAGRRPAIVLSPAAYNAKTSLAFVCPITSQIKGYPFEVIIPNGLPITGAVLSDHLRSLDWKSRRWEFICRLPESTVEEIAAKILPLIVRE